MQISARQHNINGRRILIKSCIKFLSTKLQMRENKKAFISLCWPVHLYLNLYFLKANEFLVYLKYNFFSKYIYSFRIKK